MLQMHEAFLDMLPDRPSERVSERYMFLDTRKVIDDMADLGFEVYGFRRPNSRTVGGLYGVHEVDFRRPADMDRPRELDQVTPRILFLNSYDGSRKAMIAAGLFRLVCLNGLVVGESVDSYKFLHLGDYADELMKQIRNMAQTHKQVFDKIEGWREIRLEPEVAEKMAEEAIALRFPNDELRPTIKPRNLLQPRRREDTSPDLWTRFNVLQENLIKGGVPLENQKGQARLASPVGNITRSNELNRGLWDLADRYATAA